VARGNFCNFIFVVFLRVGRWDRWFGCCCRANSDLCLLWYRFALLGAVGGRGVSMLCLIRNCLHTFLSAMMLSQYCHRCFCRARLVCRVVKAVLPVGDTVGDVAKVSCLGLSGCAGLLVPDFPCVCVFDSRF
jgi:hypothetical protein